MSINTGTKYVNFEHQDSSGLSYRSTLTDGSTIYGDGSPVELDPMGNNVGTASPYIEYPIDYQPSPDYPNLRSLFDDSPTYIDGQIARATLDGMPINYSAAMSMLQNGSAIPASIAWAQNLRGFSFENRGLGIFTTFIPGHYFSTPNGKDDDVIRIGSTGYVPPETRTYYFGNISWGSQPQPQQQTQSPKATKQQDDFSKFLNKGISQDCIDALTKLGVWNTIKGLAKTAKLYDVDQIQSQKASTYFGVGEDTKGKNLGEYFDLDNDFDAITHRGSGKGAGITGIYYRSSKINLPQSFYLRLHETTHLAYPRRITPGDQDELLATALDVAPQTGILGNRETYSEAVSRFFNNKCDPRQTAHYRENHLPTGGF